MDYKTKQQWEKELPARKQPKWTWKRIYSHTHTSVANPYELDFCFSHFIFACVLKIGCGRKKRYVCARALSSIILFYRGSGTFHPFGFGLVHFIFILMVFFFFISFVLFLVFFVTSWPIQQPKKNNISNSGLFVFLLLQFEFCYALVIQTCMHTYIYPYAKYWYKTNTSGVDCFE